MKDDLTVRNAEDRCPSKDVERPGHTHLCRLAKGHDERDAHQCICLRTWRGGTR